MVREGKMQLNELVCVITGAGGAVGRQLVKTFHDRGSRVVAILHGSKNELVEVEPNHFTIEGDLIDGESTRRIMETILGRFGQIDVLINAAGGFQAGKPVEETSMEQWKTMLSINFITTLNCCRIVLPEMKKRDKGKIINFGSTPGEEGMAEASAYAVSKAAVHALTKSISKETRDLNIDSVVVLPETIDTPNNRKAMPDADPDTWLKPEDLARQLATLIEQDQFDPDHPVIHIQPGESSQEEETPDTILSVFDRVESTEGESSVKEESVEEKESETTVDETEKEEQAELKADESEAEKPAESEEENSIDVDSNMVTFSMVTHLKSRGLYQRALEVLDALLQKGGDQDRVIQEKREIQEMLGMEPTDTEEEKEETQPETAQEETEEPSDEEKPEPELGREEAESEASSILIKSEPSEDQATESKESDEAVSSETEDSAHNDKSEEEVTSSSEAETTDKEKSDEQGSSLLKSVKGISSSTITLLTILVVVSFLSIQDQMNPETSLVAKFMSVVTGYYPPSGQVKKVPAGGKTVMVSGFIDTLSDQDEDSTHEQTPEAQVRDTAVVVVVPGSTASATVQEDTSVTPAVVMDTITTDTVKTPSSAVMPEGPEQNEALQDSVQEQVQDQPAQPDTTVSEAASNPEELFANELFHEAARAWSEEKRAQVEHYTIVLEYVCKETTIRNAYKALGKSPDFFLLPKQINDQGCFIVCVGDFPDLETAGKRLQEIPDWFEENGAKPRVRLLRKVL
jgi:NAD(P)-dependent dehydrogenase (short-subunit alcohol dehydrogenase family)